MQQRLFQPRERERLHFLLVLALRQGGELVAKLGEQQGTEGSVAGDQRQHRLFGQLVGHHFFLRLETVAGLAGHQTATVEGVVRSVHVQHVFTIELYHAALDDHVQVARLVAHIQNHLAATEIGNVHVVAHLVLFGLAQAVEGRGGKIEGVGHGGRGEEGKGDTVAGARKQPRTAPPRPAALPGQDCWNRSQSNGGTVTPSLQVLRPFHFRTAVRKRAVLLPYVYVNVDECRAFLSGKGYKSTFVTGLTFV